MHVTPLTRLPIPFSHACLLSHLGWGLVDLVYLVYLVGAVEGEKSETSGRWGMVCLVYLVYLVCLVGRIGSPTRRTKETRQARTDWTAHPLRQQALPKMSWPMYPAVSCSCGDNPATFVRHHGYQGKH